MKDADQSLVSWRTGLLSLDTVALLYVAVPNIIFLSTWIVAPWGWIAGCAVALCVLSMIPRAKGTFRISGFGRRWWLIFALATGWCVAGGLGHLVYANIDWIVRDAVLVDLVREPWPVRYHIGGEALLLRSAIGYYLPAALVGKVTSIHFADFASLAWTIFGVVLTFMFLLRDRPGWSTCFIRLAVFVLFSGMDIVPTVVRNYSYAPGAMIEWWGRYISFQSQTTSLFWAPNHTMSVWIATAWLATQPFRAISIRHALLFVILIPLSSPIAALGVALFVAAVIVHRSLTGQVEKVVYEVLDLRIILTGAVSVFLVFPYLVAGSGEIRSGFFWDLPWVGEDFLPRYMEFVLVEFLIVSIVLLLHRPRDPLLWLATGLLLALPLYRFGPFNDLSMRGSIPGLEILAIRLGTWMGEWVTTGPVRQRRVLQWVAAALLGVGSITPLLEFARPVVLAAWPMDTRKSVVEVSHGASHYVTPNEGGWVRHILDPVTRWQGPEGP